MNIRHVVLQSDKIEHVAVAICRTSRGNTHTGVVYRHSDKTVHLFHQAWDHDTKDQPISDGSAEMGGPFFCVIPKLHPVRASAIAGFWEMVASRGEQIAYALRDDPEALFDSDTHKLTLPNGRGLSCSTFVLVLFRSVSFYLIDATGWPINRPGDKEWLEFLVKLLEETCDDEEHVEAVKQEVADGCIRIRPEEVAGAAMRSAYPVRHPEAEDAGLFILGGLGILSHFRNGMK